MRRRSAFRRAEGRLLLAALFCVLLCGAVTAAATAAGADARIREILFAPVSGSSIESSAELESGHYRLEGDIYVTAVVDNLGDVAVQDYRVDFFYKEQVTERTGRIASDGVVSFGIAASGSETVRPTVVWHTSEAPNGLYEIIAVVTLLSQADTDLCNNTIPASLAGSGCALGSAVKAIVFTSGEGFSDIVGSSPYPFTDLQGNAATFIPQSGCVYGDSYSFGGSPNLLISCVNLSNEDRTLSSTDLKFSFRYREPGGEWSNSSSSFEPADEMWTVQSDETFEPGELKDDVKTALQPGFMNDVLTAWADGTTGTVSLGETYEVQVSLALGDEKTGWSVLLPQSGGSLTFTGPFDAWTFPTSTGCGGADPAEKAEIRRSVEPTTDGGYAYFVREETNRTVEAGGSTTTLSGDVIYAVSTQGGGALWNEPILNFLGTGCELTSIAVIDDPSSGGVLLYVGWVSGRGSGGVASYQSVPVAGTGGAQWTTALRWTTDAAVLDVGSSLQIAGMGATTVGEIASAPVVGYAKGVTQAAAAITDIRIYVSSREGVWQISDAAAVSSVGTRRLTTDEVVFSPLYIAATGHVWYVNNRGELFYVDAGASNPTPIQLSTDNQDVTTPLTPHSVDQDGQIVVVGTDNGDIFVFTTGVSSTTGNVPQRVDSRDIAGSSDIHAVYVWDRKNLATAQIFAASDAGKILECRFNGSTLDKDTGGLVNLRAATDPSLGDGNNDIVLDTDENTGLIVIGNFVRPQYLYVTAKDELWGFEVGEWTVGSASLNPTEPLVVPVPFDNIASQDLAKVSFYFKADDGLTALVYDPYNFKILVGSGDGSVHAFREDLISQ